MTAFTTRFAPSPTGYLHLGHAYSALLAHRAAVKAGGGFVLRIEDIDLGRCRPKYEDAIYEDLGWLGLAWETPVRRQSAHFDFYTENLNRLIGLGVMYRCFKTRKEIAADIERAPHLAADGPDGPQYVGSPLSPAEEQQRIAAGDGFAWRLSTKRAVNLVEENAAPLGFEVAAISDDGALRTQTLRVAATPAIFGDPILARKDFGASYHLSSVVDDALQGVTHIIRGEDLAAAAHLHVLLQALLGLPTPVYAHHRLVTDDSGKRLAKRDKARTIRALREAGSSPSEVQQMAMGGPQDDRRP